MTESEVIKTNQLINPKVSDEKRERYSKDLLDLAHLNWNKYKTLDKLGVYDIREAEDKARRTKTLAIEGGVYGGLITGIAALIPGIVVMDRVLNKLQEFPLIDEAKTVGAGLAFTGVVLTAMVVGSVVGERIASSRR